MRRRVVCYHILYLMHTAYGSMYVQLFKSGIELIYLLSFINFFKYSQKEALGELGLVCLAVNDL